MKKYATYSDLSLMDKFIYGGTLLLFTSMSLIVALASYQILYT